MASNRIFKCIQNTKINRIWKLIPAIMRVKTFNCLTCLLSADAECQYEDWRSYLETLVPGTADDDAERFFQAASHWEEPYERLTVEDVDKAWDFCIRKCDTMIPLFAVNLLYSKSTTNLRLIAQWSLNMIIKLHLCD